MSKIYQHSGEKDSKSVNEKDRKKRNKGMPMLNFLKENQPPMPGSAGAEESESPKEEEETYAQESFLPIEPVNEQSEAQVEEQPIKEDVDADKEAQVDEVFEQPEDETAEAEIEEQFMQPEQEHDESAEAEVEEQAETEEEGQQEAEDSAEELEESGVESQDPTTAEAVEEEQLESGVEDAEGQNLVLQGEFISKYLSLQTVPKELDFLSIAVWNQWVGRDGGVPAALDQLHQARAAFQTSLDFNSLRGNLQAMITASQSAQQGVQSIKAEMSTEEKAQKEASLLQFEQNLQAFERAAQEQLTAFDAVRIEAEDYIQNPAVIRNKSVMAVFLQHGLEHGGGFSPYFRLIRAVERKMDPELIFHGCIMNEKRAKAAMKKGKVKSPKPDKIELPAKLANQLWSQYVQDPQNIDYKKVFKFARTAIRRVSLKDFLLDSQTGLFSNWKLFSGLVDGPMPNFRKYVRKQPMD